MLTLAIAAIIIGLALATEQYFDTARTRREWAANDASFNPDTLNFVVLENDDLQSKIEYLQSANQPLTTFTDYGNITAIATGPFDWDSTKRSHFAGDRLLRFTT